MNWLDAIKWDERGLVPAIAQDAQTGRVLMLAWMDRAALAATDIDPITMLFWAAVINGVVAVPIMLAMMPRTAPAATILISAAPAGRARAGPNPATTTSPGA